MERKEILVEYLDGLLRVVHAEAELMNKPPKMSVSIPTQIVHEILKILKSS